MTVAVAIAAMAIGIVLVTYSNNNTYRSDFELLLFGGRSLLRGIDPYPLVGPGRTYDLPWHLIYPASALEIAVPFTAMSGKAGTASFIGLSTFLLAYGATRRDWHLLPLFLSEAFLSSARLGQVSILATATLFLPQLFIWASVKPQTFLPPLIAARSRIAWIYAIVGTVVLLSISIAVVPKWPIEWLSQIRNLSHMKAPILRPGGFLVLLALLRWRRPEAWLLIAMAVSPQSWGWYNTLPLFTIPANFRQSLGLLVWVTLAGVLGAALIPSNLNREEFYNWGGALHVFSIYLPCVAMILARGERIEDSPARLDLIPSHGSVSL